MHLHVDPVSGARRQRRERKRWREGVAGCGRRETESNRLQVGFADVKPAGRGRAIQGGRCNWSPYDNLNYQSSMTAAICRFNFRGQFPRAVLPRLPGRDPIGPGISELFASRSRLRRHRSWIFQFSIVQRRVAAQSKSDGIREQRGPGAHDRGKIIIERNWIHRPLCPRACVEFFRTRPNYPAKSYWFASATIRVCVSLLALAPGILPRVFVHTPPRRRLKTQYLLWFDSRAIVRARALSVRLKPLSPPY